MSTTARDWFTDEREFRQLCGDAVSLAEGEKPEEFVHEMMRAANRYGLDCNLSERQLKWLCDIADHDVPPRRVP